MSLWYCEEHGLVGPEACCGKASVARIEASNPDPLAAGYVEFSKAYEAIGNDLFKMEIKVTQNEMRRMIEEPWLRNILERK